MDDPFTVSPTFLANWQHEPGDYDRATVEVAPFRLEVEPRLDDFNERVPRTWNVYLLRDVDGMVLFSRVLPPCADMQMVKERARAWAMDIFWGPHQALKNT